MVKAIAADVLIQSQRHSEVSCLFRFLFYDGQTIPVTVLYNVCKPQMDNVRDTQAYIRFKGQGGGNPLIWPASGKALFHGLDDGLILLLCQSNGFDIHADFLL